MRKYFTVAVICFLAVVPVLRLHPLPPAPPTGLPVVLDADLQWSEEGEWFGGLSGLDVAADGKAFVAVTDRGHKVRGEFVRQDGRLVAVARTEAAPLRDSMGAVREFPFTDAEAVALHGNAAVYIAFEHAHRVLQYTAWDSPARWPAYTRSWRALHENRGLEALAIDEVGTLFAIPEQVSRGAYEALVYKRPRGSDWTQPYTLPLSDNFRPVGADIGPDGKLYVLERAFEYGGFRTRVRRFHLAENGLEDAETILQTPLWRHGNLEGLAVWYDTEGRIRLTMVSDDNFLWVLDTRVVEYVMPATLAASPR